MASKRDKLQTVSKESIARALVAWVQRVRGIPAWGLGIRADIVSAFADIHRPPTHSQGPRTP